MGDAQLGQEYPPADEAGTEQAAAADESLCGAAEPNDLERGDRGAQAPAAGDTGPAAGIAMPLETAEPIEVIDVEAQAIDDEKRPAASAPSAANKAAGAALGMAKNAASTLKAGAFAVRDVHNASRQSAEARAQARTIKDALAIDQATLDHRRQVEAGYEAILAEQTKVVADKKAVIEADQQKIDGLSEEHSALVADLDELKASNASAIRPYKHLVETSKEALDDAQRTLAEAKRAMKSAESQLADAKDRRDATYASASRAFDNSQSRQRKVQEELKKLQSSGGAPAAISQMQSDNVAALASVDSARAEVERATKDGQNAVDNAQTHLWTQKQSLESAQARYDDALAKHKAHKAEHDKMSDDAAQQEKKLQESIDGKKRELDALRSEVDQAQKAQDEAQGLIDEANLIHSTPEETERLEQSIAAQQADLDEANTEVEHLAATEKQLRQATRGPRGALIAAAVVVVLIAVFVIVSCAGGAK